MRSAGFELKLCDKDYGIAHFIQRFGKLHSASLQASVEEATTAEHQDVKDIVLEGFPRWLCPEIPLIALNSVRL